MRHHIICSDSDQPTWRDRALTPKRQCRGVDRDLNGGSADGVMCG
jgi:hypothetical protein